MLYKKLVRPLLFKKDSDYVHERALDIGKFLSHSLLSKPLELAYKFSDKSLNTRIFGINFNNPMGLAAGFDKTGEVVNSLSSLGFGFVEIGSITTHPREGNPKPRTFRLPKEKAIINKAGLPNKGADKVYEKLKGKKFKIPVGVNIAKTPDIHIIGEVAIHDMCYSFWRLYNIGDYLTLNISCPNTLEGKIFEDKNLLNDLFSSLNEIKARFTHKKPVFLKISPDLSYESLDEILDIAEDNGIDGYVISNTSLRKYDLKTTPVGVAGIGECGISGRPIRKKSTKLIKHVHKYLPKRIIIGVGGIFSAKDAYKKIRAGASLIQVYTGLIYEGPGLVKKINKGLVRRLRRDGFSCLKEAVGSDVK